jgi:hypothetical protein
METPEVIIPAVCTPQLDGSVLVKAGKPVLVEVEIGTREASRILGRSPRWVRAECDLSRFKTAHKPGTQIGSWWKIARSEVVARKESGQN